ncbi:MAG: alpha-ribazole phosphatase family protein [Candidatus Accumulibacter sp.]|nr:alpha-ribazole phosphatase family protein [Accumulibacter sp.]
MQLFLIRHPRPLVDAGFCYGQLDLAAEDPGPIADRLRPLISDATPVLASPLRRARQLAEALHRQPRFDARLMEMSFGDWEGQPWQAIDRALLDAWAADPLQFIPPGGESVAALQARVLACLASQHDPRLVIVAHAGVIRLILGHYLTLDFAEWSRLPIDFGSLSGLEIGDMDRPSGELLFLNR